MKFQLSNKPLNPVPEAVYTLGDKLKALDVIYQRLNCDDHQAYAQIKRQIELDLKALAGRTLVNERLIDLLLAFYRYGGQAASGMPVLPATQDHAAYLTMINLRLAAMHDEAAAGNGDSVEDS